MKLSSQLRTHMRKARHTVYTVYAYINDAVATKYSSKVKCQSINSLELMLRGRENRSYEFMVIRFRHNFVVDFYDVMP